MPDMPIFRDPDNPEIVWVWDSESHDYVPKRNNHQPLRSWESGGGFEADPATMRFRPKNPTQEGILASRRQADFGDMMDTSDAYGNPGVEAPQSRKCFCGASIGEHEWNPQWGCPVDGPESYASRARSTPKQPSNIDAMPMKVPRENDKRRDHSFPSMSLSSADSIDDMSDVRARLAAQYAEKYGADLSSCPDCATPLKEMSGEMVCSGCGNRQPILTMEAAVREGAALGVGLIGRLMGGAMAPGAMAGAGGMLGRGAMFGMGQNMVPGMGQPEEELPMMPVQSVAAYGLENFGLGGPTGADPGPGPAAAQKYRELRMQGVDAGTAMQEVAAEFFDGDLAVAQQAIGANVQLTGKTADFDDEVGMATKNRGDDDNPEHKTQGFNEEHGDSPEMLKDVELLGGSQEGEDGDSDDSALADEAMKMFHANLPLVIEFAESEESGQDHPILKALDELLEQAFPGYKDLNEESEEERDDSDNAEPEQEKKEAASWGMPSDPNAGFAAPGQQTGVVSINDTCPIDGAGPGVPCVHKQVTQEQAGQNAGQSAPGIPGVQGIPSQVPALWGPTMANVDEQIEKQAARRPKMCPFHADLVDYSLTLGDPTAALTALSPSGYGRAFCKSGEYEGNCNFKAPMVTQAYWDAKDAEYAERAEQRRLEQEALQTRVPEVQVEPAPEPDMTIPEPDAINTGVDTAVEDDGGGASYEGAPSAVGIGAEEAYAQATAAIRDHRVASRRKLSMFELLSEEDLGGAVAEAPRHIEVAKGEGENLSDEAPESHSDAHQKTKLPEHHHPEAEHPVSEDNRDKATIHDAEGRPLQEGETYLMKSPDYAIPDKVTIDAIEGDQITYTVHTDLTSYQDQTSIKQLQLDGLSFIEDTAHSDPVFTDSQEEYQQPPRPDAVGGPGEVTDLSDLPTAVSAVKEAMPAQMSRQDFIAIAEILQRHGVNAQMPGLVDDLVAMMQQSNPRFNEEHFRSVIEPGQNVNARPPAQVFEGAEKDAGNADHLKEFQFKKKDAEPEEEEEAVEKEAAADVAVVNDEMELVPLPDENMVTPEIKPEDIKPVDREAAMKNPELIMQAGGTEYVAKFEGDDPNDRDWIFGGDGKGVEVDPHLAAKYAGKNFTPREQREFIDESGSARNLDKLDLADTHYIEEDDLDAEFLFGRRG